MAQHWITVDQGPAFPCADTQFILEAAWEQGVDLPFRCRSASCGACEGQVVQGRVERADHGALSDESLAQGAALLCASYPLSDCRIRLCRPFRRGG